MKILVFSPHPDDSEVLMGGTIARYTQAGHEVLIALVTIPNQKELRIKESSEAAKILGARLQVLDLDPYKLTYNRELVGIFDKVIEDFSPDAIYTSWIHDSHQDHINVAQASISAARKNRSSLYMYEQALPAGLTPFAFRPQVFVDISETMETKIESVMAHKSQILNFTEHWVQSISAKATYLGFRINVKYAEAFEVVKEIQVI